MKVLELAVSRPPLLLLNRCSSLSFHEKERLPVHRLLSFKTVQLFASLWLLSLPQSSAERWAERTVKLQTVADSFGLTFTVSALLQSNPVTDYQHHHHQTDRHTDHYTWFTCFLHFLIFYIAFLVFTFNFLVWHLTWHLFVYSFVTY